MGDRNVESAWNYHNGSKHPDGDLMNPRHRYDPMRNPLPFKIYPDIDPIHLTLGDKLLDMPALTALAANITVEADAQVPNIDQITRILHFSAGITKTLRIAGREMSFRAAACTGALYHIELYLVCGNLAGLDAGVYHFDPRESSLGRLRKGDYRRALVDSSGQELSVANAPAILVFTDVFWRNAVKYQAREYRHAFWDSGTIIANTLAVATACGLPASVVVGFVDEVVNNLLSLETQTEVATALVPIGHVLAAVDGPSPEIDQLELKTVPVSDYEIDFPSIRQMHKTSSLTNPEGVAAWRDGPAPTSRTASPLDAPIHLEPLADDELPQEPIERVITRRGSARQFSREPITFHDLSTILHKATNKFPADFLKPKGISLTEIYLIVNAVDGLKPGKYVYHGDSGRLECILQGDFRYEAGRMGLGQALAADASVNMYFLTDLDSILNRFGNRGYRAAQLEASITAGRIYIGAYALRLGATGLTFYDDAVIDFFSPHAEGKSVMFLLGVGRRARRR